jgi:hypothetical protein
MSAKAYDFGLMDFLFLSNALTKCIAKNSEGNQRRVPSPKQRVRKTSVRSAFLARCMVRPMSTITPHSLHMEVIRTTNAMRNKQ